MRTQGFTILELLVVLVIFTGVLTIATRFLASQSQDTRIVQERNEVQDRARLVLQMVSQDLILAGSSRFIGATRCALMRPTGFLVHPEPPA